MKYFIRALIATCIGTLIIGLNTKEHNPPLPEQPTQAVVEAPVAPLPVEAVPEPIPVVEAIVEAPAPVYVAPKQSGGCPELRDKLLALGVGAGEIDSAITLAQRESSCNEFARNNDGGACGYFQSLPCGKWGLPGSDTYLPGAINYVRVRYGDYNNALAHSYSHNWY